MTTLEKMETMAQAEGAAQRTQPQGMPADYVLGIVPASDTGAVEMALWSMLGARQVDVFAWESFGEEWVTDAVDQLRLADCRIHVGRAYGELPDLSLARATADIVFTQNGTTSGVKIPKRCDVKSQTPFTTTAATLSCPT